MATNTQRIAALESKVKALVEQVAALTARIKALEDAPNLPKD